MNVENNRYITIKKRVEATIRVKASRFMGLAIPVSTVEHFREELYRRQKEYHDATHHCWAFRIIVNDRIEEGLSDAGEPTGTAGKPILSTIQGRNLVDVGVIITRYFGGTKLGTGGLARAYAECTDLTLENSQIISKIITEQVTCQFPYDYMNIVMRAIDKYEGFIVDSVYSNNATLSVSIPRDLLHVFLNELSDACRGTIHFEISD